jgi:integrase
VPNIEAVALTPEQVAVLLDAADHTPSPWLGTWTVLAAATGARNGELCGLQWADLDLDAATVRFRQALTTVDPAVLPGVPAAGDPDSGVGGRRKELAVGPLKSAASSAILTLPPFAVQALRRHRHKQLVGCGNSDVAVSCGSASTRDFGTAALPPRQRGCCIWAKDVAGEWRSGVRFPSRGP